jgi:hypothetical protein
MNARLLIKKYLSVLFDKINIPDQEIREVMIVENHRKGNESWEIE